MDRRALVVESDSASAVTICQSLADLGFQVTAVPCAVEALIAARSAVPTIIFLAMQLRDATGRELANWLRSNRTLAEVPIVAMYSWGETTPSPAGAGYAALLRKPTSTAKIAQAVRNVIPATG